MLTSVFSAACPQCGNEVHPVDAERDLCFHCNQTYLPRVGYLIPVDGSPSAETPYVDLRQTAAQPAVVS